MFTRSRSCTNRWMARDADRGDGSPGAASLRCDYERGSRLVILGFPIALILAWAFELTPEGIKRTEDVDLSKSIARGTGRKLTGIVIAVAFVALGLFLFQIVGIGRRASQSDAEHRERQSVTAYLLTKNPSPFCRSLT